MTWICQLCSMTKTSEKYERTQQGNLLAGPVHTEIVSSRLLVWQVSNCQRILPANYSIFRFNFDPFYACNGHIMKIVANKKKWHVETGMFETFHSEQSRKLHIKDQKQQNETKLKRKKTI